MSIHGNDELAREPVKKNLAYRAVDELRRELKIRGGVEIELHKKIPAGGGLGGGSSNAAAALFGYLQLTGRKLPMTVLAELAASLGADVPIFLFGGRALGIGRGDEIYPLPDIAKLIAVGRGPQRHSRADSRRLSLAECAGAQRGYVDKTGRRP